MLIYMVPAITKFVEMRSITRLQRLDHRFGLFIAVW